MYLAYTQDSDPPTNVRSQPGAQSPIIGHLDNGTVVTVKEVSNNWREITQPVQGYVSASLILPKNHRIYRETVGSIAVWQHLLNGCGYHPDGYPRLTITGELDAETITITKKFQHDMGLPETGVVDNKTWELAFDHPKLQGWKPIEPFNSIEPPSNQLNESKKYDYCQEVILEQGGKFRDGGNQRNLISFRKETSTKADDWKGLYDDLTFMLWKDANENKHCIKYQSCTEPSSWFEDSTDTKAKGLAMGVDADRDGRLDLGCLPEGYYTYKIDPVPDDLLGDVLRPTEEAINAIRDIDHDGVFELDEPTASAGYTMLFHAGLSWRTGSAGCQTMRPDEYARFWHDLNANGEQGEIGYTILRWTSL